MARKLEHYDNIFAESNIDKFVIEAVNAQSLFTTISNPYVGNKKKILVEIAKAIYENFEYNNIRTVCDLFSGSFVVGSFFKKLGKTVYSNELLLSSYMNGVALQKSYNHQISASDWLFLLNNKNLNSDKFIENIYAGKRFTHNESVFMDNYFANVNELYGKTDNIRLCVAFSTIMQFIMSHCFVGGRLNNGQVIAALEHRLQHQRNNNCEMDFSEMKPFCFDCGDSDSYLYNLDVFDFLNQEKTKFDLIYIDPPYGGQQSDYASMYQFFEEYLSRKPYNQIDYLREKSDKFSKAKKYKDSFSSLLNSLPKDSSWMISYNNSSWADIDVIAKMVGEHKKNVVVKEIKYSYKYRSSDNSDGVEYFVIGQ